QQAGAVAAIADRYAATLRAGGTLFFAGNGGSAADAQHLATEYVVRYQAQRSPLRAVALTTDTSLLTACANDLGFDEVFARQIEALARPGDVLSLHSTSGESPNVIRAAQAGVRDRWGAVNRPRDGGAAGASRCPRRRRVSQPEGRRGRDRRGGQAVGRSGG